MIDAVIDDELDQILGDRAVRAIFQPIVDLATGATVAFEALARGPEGSALERPDQLFAAARTAGRLGELDWACRSAALRGALDGKLPRSVSLFVNVEPSVAHVPPTPEALELVIEAGRALAVVIEVTERALVTAPAELLAQLDLVRRHGWGVALDDVGAEVASLALMPLLRPDVIKLDLRLVQDQPDPNIAAIVGAVNAQAERTGARVLAEGIETPAHLAAGLAMGATLGQGWLFDRPGPLPVAVRQLGGGIVPAAVQAAAPASTVAAASAGRPLRRSTKPLLLEMSRHLEQQALDGGAPVVIVSAFQTADRFTPATARRYVALAAQAALVGALGIGMPEQPGWGVRGGQLLPGDPLVDEWAIAVVTPHFAAALAAADLGDEGPDHERRFDFVLTYERDRVLAVVASLLARIAVRTTSD